MTINMPTQLSNILNVTQFESILFVGVISDETLTNYKNGTSYFSA